MTNAEVKRPAEDTHRTNPQGPTPPASFRSCPQRFTDPRENCASVASAHSLLRVLSFAQHQRRLGIKAQVSPRVWLSPKRSPTLEIEIFFSLYLPAVHVARPTPTSSSYFTRVDVADASCIVYASFRPLQLAQHSLVCLQGPAN